MMSSFSTGINKNRKVRFNKIPTSLRELKYLPEAALKDPYHTAALLIPALCLWPTNRNESIDMINFLRGPGPLSTYEVQFISERLRENEYIPMSYLEGANAENGYRANEPFTVVVSAVPSSFTEKGYAMLYLKSGGADSMRPVKLREKPSTGQWFLTDQMLLAQIRKPISEDPWA
ncbi:MAG TPA: hypothetical protein VFD89_01705 [Clostridia bacterium]|nr:hypothetical protein [Clostridia bacterium]